MVDRRTATSRTVEYETSTCVHCDDEVFVDRDVENVDDLPEAVHVVVGGGDHISVDETSFTARSKDYRTPTVLVKWFLGESSRESVTRQHLCPACAEAVYGFET